MTCSLPPDPLLLPSSATHQPPPLNLSPSVSLTLSSLSSTKSHSTPSSACSSPPSYKQLSSPANLPPPFLSPHHLHHPRWHYPLRSSLRLSLFFKTRLLQSVGLFLIFLVGYLLGSHSLTNNRNLSQHSRTSQLARLVLRKPHIPFLVKLPSPSSQSLDPHNRQLQLTRPAHKIPSILHYVFGMDPDFGGKPFGFIHYASIQSAVQILRPERVYFHYLHRPSGWWFDRALEIHGFQLVKAREVTEVYGRPVKHFAHKADIIRLEALRDHGGIYLDLDVFVVRNFDPLLDSDVVLGQEVKPRPTFARRPGSEAVDQPVGLCNAVILAKPFAPFITRWLSSYRTFDHHRWADHSSVVPWALAQAHPDELTVLGPRAFFYPLWHEDDLWLVHKTTDWDFDRSGQYVYHAWSSISFSNHLQTLDPDRIHASGGIDRGESSFTYFVRRFIHDAIREQWREARLNRTLGL